MRAGGWQTRFEWRNESKGRLGRLRWDGAHSDTPAPSTDLEILRKV